jgi:hypothetical protein
MDDPKSITSLLCVWMCFWPVVAIFVAPPVAMWLDRTGKLDALLTRLQRRPRKDEEE